MRNTKIDVPDVPVTEDPEVVLLNDKVAIMPAEQSAPKVVACVTGATSYVGGHVVRRLFRVLVVRSGKNFFFLSGGGGEGGEWGGIF